MMESSGHLRQDRIEPFVTASMGAHSFRGGDVFSGIAALAIQGEFGTVQVALVFGFSDHSKACFPCHLNFGKQRAIGFTLFACFVGARQFGNIPGMDNRNHHPTSVVSTAASAIAIGSSRTNALAVTNRAVSLLD